ncbi:hypothetical protein BU16DRAFT_450805 [Lophium mytilinum]|uniref:Uncharacterized protein n=1 Tax=Lophium mytilinum TaxID=390894 RepID=A0A6A6RDS3_9PEZI|nr:hypothetical protein BU16DRAFT_450805 [Lophium mytilinum]
MPQPVVVVRSWGARLSLFGAQVRYVQDDGIHEGVLWSNVSDLIGKFGGLDEGLKDIYPPIWRTSPEPGSSSIVGSFLQYTCGNDNVSQTFRLEELLAKDCLLLLTYTVSAFWETSQVELMVNDAMPVVRTGPLAVPKPGKPEYTSPITMDLDGISYFNSISVTEALRDASPSFIAYLAALFATALCEDSKSLLLLPKQLDIYDPYELGSTPIKIFQTQYGYGYDTSTTSVRLSIAVIMTYCVVTLAYMIYILISGSTSTTWDSAMELVLLALQSRTPDHLGHISAGVDSMDTYREAVGIRVSDGDELELVFKHDRDYGERNLRKITPNRAY